PTTQSDISLSEYDLFIFDLCPPSDRSDFYEFTDELAHIISPPKYNCFYFWNLPDPGELMSVLNFGIRENLSSITRVNLPIEDDYSPLLSPTTHSDSSLYALFIFDLSINPFPPANRSDFYEFFDELIPFISPPEYNCFLFKVEPNSRDFTKDVVEDISPTKEPQVYNALPTHPTLQLNLKFHPSSDYLFTYVVWIFHPSLVYSVAPHYLQSLRNEDTIFDLGICNSCFSRPDVSHRCGTVKKFNTHRSHLNECPMLINEKNTPILDVPLFHFYPP
nr:hypothetical protein [Tanacetum cinerariifolium]